MKECQVCKQCFPDVVEICPQDNIPTFHSIVGDPLFEGKYKLEKRLGQGGMGVVYQARHNYLKTAHAIKVILPDLVGNDPQLATRFRQEALAAAAIRHQNVVSVSDYGVAQGKMPFLVMEFVEGESLQDLLAREKKLSPEKAVELMAAICAGVGAAHRQGIVHRDLKPLNVMIHKGDIPLSESVKILDFGLAKIKSGELLGSFIQAQTTGLMGSPYYMAPEQWADEEPDAQADIYSLGVMLFQMITGDVPFKASSIPAIMKKHLSDPPPTMAEMGTSVSPQLEAAVRHTLEKDRHQRTQTVQQLVEELRAGIGMSSQSGRPATVPLLPVSSLHVLTNPPQSSVYLNSVRVGETQNDGWLLVEGIQSGNHHIKVSKEGFYDWESDVFCDGKPQQVVAQLRNATTSIGDQDPAKTVVDQGFQLNTPQNFSTTQDQSPEFLAQNTVPLIQNTGDHQARQSQTNMSVSGQQFNHSQQPVVSVQPAKKPMFSPLLLAITGIFALLLLTAIGVGGAYMLGLFGKSGGVTANKNSNSQPANTNANKAPDIVTKGEMVEVPGGKFLMGNDQGQDREKPEHEVSVKDFLMDRTEVTNAEYFEFVKQTNHVAPSNWADGKPVAGEEMFPVSRVSLDDAKEFIKWRSKRDGVEYRLPTEEEWEYAARNGSDRNLYPWGDKWEQDRAILNVTSPKNVGSSPNGANKWGIHDLIGNISEWTSSKFEAYPGGKFEAKKDAQNTFVTRGGSYNISSTDAQVTSATRYFAPPTAKDGRLGFRLVRSK